MHPRVSLANQRPQIMPITGNPVARHQIIHRRTRIGHRVPNMIRRPRLMMGSERPWHQLPHPAAAILWAPIGLTGAMRIRVDQINRIRPEKPDSWSAIVVIPAIQCARARGSEIPIRSNASSK